MAKGLGFAGQPQGTSPVNPSGNPNRRVRTMSHTPKFTPRRTPYYWMAQNNLPSSGYGDIGYGLKRRGKHNNDTGSVPGAYTDYIER